MDAIDKRLSSGAKKIELGHFFRRNLSRDYSGRITLAARRGETWVQKLVGSPGFEPRGLTVPEIYAVSSTETDVESFEFNWRPHQAI